MSPREGEPRADATAESESVETQEGTASTPEGEGPVEEGLRPDREPPEAAEASEEARPPEDGEAPAGAPDVAALRAEADEYRDMLQRLKADFDNYRRRSERSLAESRMAGAADLARELLGVLDNLERAVASGDEGEALRAGLEMTLRQMRAVLERAGVKRIAALGAPFDPEVHEALASVPSDEAPPGTVTQVFEEGYKMGDRLLRPARVAVAAETPTGGEATDG